MKRNVKLWHKMAMVALLSSLPVVTVISLFVRAHNEQIARAGEERRGISYLRPMRKLMQSMPRHRTLVYTGVATDPAHRAALLDVEKDIDAAIAAMDAADQRIGRQAGLTNSWEQFKVNWRDLKDKTPQLTPKESLARHNKVITDLLLHLRLAGDKTGLTTDNALDGFYLADSLLVQVAWTAEYMAQLEALGSSAASRGKLTAEEDATARNLVRQISFTADLVERNMQSAFRYNPKLEPALGGFTTTASTGAGFVTNVTHRELLDAEAITVGGGPYRQMVESSIDKYYVLYDKLLDDLDGLLAARIEDLTAQKTSQLSIAITVLLLAVLGTYLIQRGMTSQMRAIRELFAQLHKGDYAARCEIRTKDELGVLAGQLNGMLDQTVTLIQSREERDQIQQSIRQLLDDVSVVAEGDLSKEAAVTTDVTGAIADAFNYMIQQLREIIASVQRTTAEVRTSARQVQDTAESLAQGSQEQALQIVEASASIGHMAAAVHQVSESASSATTVAREALGSARLGSESVKKTITGMDGIRGQVQETAKRIKRLGESSQEIGEIVQLISDISDRTSILALNASIQAATAGEAGRGFAVVAEEVERLAERAAESAKRIAMLIQSVQSDTGEAITAMEETTREVVAGSQLANEAGQRLSEIEAVAQRIADTVQSIAAIAQRQASESEVVSRHVASISGVSQSTAEGTRQTAGAVRRLSLLASELSDSVSRFRLPSSETREDLVQV